MPLGACVISQTPPPTRPMNLETFLQSKAPQSTPCRVCFTPRLDWARRPGGGGLGFGRVFLASIPKKDTQYVYSPILIRNHIDTHQ